MRLPGSLAGKPCLCLRGELADDGSGECAASAAWSTT